MCQTTNFDEALCTTGLPAAKDRTRPLFPLGRIVATPGVLALFEEHDTNPLEYLRRHQCGDWGNVPSEDKKSNDEALIHGNRLFSSFLVGNQKFWIITEADRSSTCALMPSEY